MKALDHKIHRIPPCLDVAQQLQQPELNNHRWIACAEPPFGVTIFDNLQQGIASLTGTSQNMHNISTTCYRVVFDRIFVRWDIGGFDRPAVGVGAAVGTSASSTLVNSFMMCWQQILTTCGKHIMCRSSASKMMACERRRISRCSINVPLFVALSRVQCPTWKVVIKSQ